MGTKIRGKIVSRKIVDEILEPVRRRDSHWIHTHRVVTDRPRAGAPDRVGPRAAARRGRTLGYVRSWAGRAHRRFPSGPTWVSSFCADVRHKRGSRSFTGPLGRRGSWPEQVRVLGRAKETDEVCHRVARRFVIVIFSGLGRAPSAC